MSKFISTFLTLSAICVCIEAKTFNLNTATKVNWYAAYQSCANQGLQLATINNQAENDQLKSQINAAGISDSYVWISATDAALEGTFVWFSTGCPVIYNDFDPAANNALGNENCVHIWKYNGKLAWNDLNCDQLLYFACEDKTCKPCNQN